MRESDDQARCDLAPIDLTGLRAAPLADQPAPTLTWVRIDAMVVDRAYQRDITVAGRRAIQRMADAFDWTKCGALQLAPLEGGRFAIVDGQHRAHAAALCGIQTVPAMIVPMTARQQAQGFAAINRDKVRVDPLQIYRAELAAGVDWAVACRDAVAAGGCQLMTSNRSTDTKRAGQVYAVGLIRKMVAAGEGAAVTAGLAAITRSTQSVHPWVYGGPVLGIWLPALAASQRFLRLDLARVFDGIDFEGLMDGSRLRARQLGRAAKQLAIEDVVATLRAFDREVQP